jgi:hypothetical protein
VVKVAILHEGSSRKTQDNELLQLLLESLGLDVSQVRFVGMGNKSNFFKEDNENYRELLLSIKNESIEKALFVVDADSEKNNAKYGGFENTQQELEKTLKKLGLNTCSDIYVTCDPDDQCGYLESLILSTIPDDQKNCIEEFLKCSDFKSKDNHKAILNKIYNIGYPESPFDFTHKNFDELKSKLQNLFEGIE